MIRLPDRVSIMSAADLSENSQGNTVPDWENAATVVEPAFVTSTSQNANTSENNVSQDQVTNTLLAILLPTTAARSDSRILWRGLEYEVDGDVMPVPDLRGRTHHCEATLRRVNG